MFNLNPFKSKEDQPQQPTSTWDPNTLTMTMAQPSTVTPAAPTQVVSQQPVRYASIIRPCLLKVSTD